MTDRKCIGVDCPRKPNTTTGRCDLHDTLYMVSEAEDLLGKVHERLLRIERTDREKEGTP
jgi:hypothetical protein